ncbi:MAG: TlyA family RNA methyltransferase [Lachnospiraceae bacterium]|nr:TlyA family RNA methyltransferase [Lachnospiraceae bacterium]
MKQRLDVLVVSLGLAQSRERAKAMIMAGDIYVNGQREDKPGSSFSEDAVVEFRGKKLPYVSRGGLKLEKAIKVFDTDVSGKICLDIGASTGGFTDCMLQNGAVKVYAVDVGYGQLDWKLRNDERVVCLEKTNARYLTRDQIPDIADLASIDVSFISLSLILGPVSALLSDKGEILCLVKPQFEAGRDKVGKKGVVSDPKVHEEVIQKVISYALDLGLVVRGLDYSPVRGPEGNIEFLLFLSKDETLAAVDIDPEAVVKKAHQELVPGVEQT